MNELRLSTVGPLIVGSGVLLIATCLLPYRFPPRTFVVGASFEVGFNNSVSYLAYAAIVPLLAIAAARLLPSLQTNGRTVLTWVSSRQFHVAAAAVILGHVVLFAALYAYKGRFVFGESLYFQSLLYRMSQGETPYIDFSFYYGPLMLYPAYWLSRSIGLDAGYGVWFVTTYVVGLVFLSVGVRFCAPNGRTAAMWFAFLAIGFFNPLTGLNVTFTRYLLPLMVFLATTNFFKNGGWIPGLIAVCSLAAALLYSFEVAALSVAATLALLTTFAVGPSWWDALVGSLATGLRLKRVERRVGGDEGLVPASRLLIRAIAVLSLAGAIGVAVFVLIDPSGRALAQYPEIASSYSGGAHNVPIYPHLPFLTLTVVTIAALAEVTRLVLTGENGFGVRAMVAYALVALGAERASFGAAEPLHFAYHGLPFFLLAIFMATRVAHSRLAAYSLAGLLLVGIMLPMQYYHLTEFQPFLTPRLTVSAASSSSAQIPASSAASVEQNLRDVVRTLGSDHPYLMYDMDYSSLPVYRDFGLRYPLYSTMLLNARDAAGIRQAIDEVRDRRAIVVVRAEDLQGSALVRRSKGIWRVLDTLTGAHTGGSELIALLLKSKQRLVAPFMEFVRMDCVPVYDEHGLMAFLAYPRATEIQP